MNHYQCIIDLFHLNQSLFFSCAPDWSSRASLPYTVYVFVVGFFAPVAVLVPSNVAVIATLRKVWKSLR